MTTVEERLSRLEGVYDHLATKADMVEVKTGMAHLATKAELAEVKAELARDKNGHGNQSRTGCTRGQGNAG